MNCTVCNNHEDEKLCMICSICDTEHKMKYGLDWPKKTNCPHHCNFTMPNNSIRTFQCKKMMAHTGPCDFGVNTDELSRMARDMR